MQDPSEGSFVISSLIGDHLLTDTERLAADLVAASENLKVLVLREAWEELNYEAIRCRGVAMGYFQVLESQAAMNRVSGRRARALSQHFGELLAGLADMDHEALDALRSAYRATRGDDDDVSRYLAALSTGASDDATLGDRLAQLPDWNELTSLGVLRDVALHALVDGLLGAIVSERHLVSRQLQGKTFGVSGGLWLDEITRHVQSFSRSLRVGQQAVFHALLAERPGGGVGACRFLINTVDAQLMPFLVFQAKAAHLMRELDAVGKNTQSEVLGRQLAAAGDLTREAIASYASAHLLVFELAQDVPQANVAELVRRMSRLQFDSMLPNGRNRELYHLSDAEDGEYVEIRGRVVDVSVDRAPDGKLISRLTLVDPSSDAEALAVAIYVHLPHRGVTEECYCVVNGHYNVASPLSPGRPAVVIDSLSLAEMRHSSFREAFFDLARPFFQRYPGGLHMQSTLSDFSSIGIDDNGMLRGYNGGAEIVYSD